MADDAVAMPARAAFQNLAVTTQDRIACLSIVRRERRNALDSHTLDELREAFDAIAESHAVGAVIVTGYDDRVFAAGADLAQMRHWGREDALAGRTTSLYRLIEALPQLTIAAVNGAARGGGCELALACDLRVAADHATFAQPEVSLGVVPSAGALQRLPRLIGLGRAKQMIFTGDCIDAATALQWGLVTAVTPAADLLRTARQLASRVLSHGPIAVRLAKLVINATVNVDSESGLLMERLAQAICFETPDKTEGIAAFLEKRAPQFGQT